ncbi:MAG: GGDEF domain-containing protein [Pseudomonas sp.]|uniref:GGDEF domain-containing protein n=1 Tax=Pseudomonas sp. TaxID=306 RepID=UPI0030F1B65A
MLQHFSSSAGKNGLEETGKRSLMRLILASSSLTIGFFSALQFSAGNLALACFELTACIVLAWGAWKIVSARNLVPWIYLFLLPTFCFVLYIIVMPQASATAFVWVYVIPLLSYLLLGRARGFLLTAPFVLASVLLYFDKYPLPSHSAALMDVFNAVFCGVLIMVFVHLYETRRAAAYDQLERQAQTDALTGVASRGSFQQGLERSILEAERSGLPLVLVIMDIDHFKQVNDSWGHDGGDEALKHICAGLLLRLRVTDSLGRLGGEEFGLILHNTDLASATPLVETLRQQIAANPLTYGGQRISLSATFGLAEWPADGHNASDLYRCADRRLYQGKAQGRNRLVAYTEPIAGQ